MILIAAQVFTEVEISGILLSGKLSFGSQIILVFRRHLAWLEAEKQTSDADRAIGLNCLLWHDLWQFSSWLLFSKFISPRCLLMVFLFSFFFFSKFSSFLSFLLQCIASLSCSTVSLFSTAHLFLYLPLFLSLSLLISLSFLNLSLDLLLNFAFSYAFVTKDNYPNLLFLSHTLSVWLILRSIPW